MQQQALFEISRASCLVVNYGGGVDSTAMLIGLMRRGIRPDAILFADTGSEKPETYDYVSKFSSWLELRGFPAITTVQRKKSRPSKTGPGYTTIEGNCLQNETLPSLAFGRKSCSLKWKADPMDSFLTTFGPAMSAWARGHKVTKCIGYDASPADCRRFAHAQSKTDARFEFTYPLQEWGWTRDRCIAEIEAEGLQAPVKSACFFCPATKKAEIRQMDPELLRRALELEDNAMPKLRTVKGLGRSFNWREFCESEGLV